jgi:16S rRNA (adenine1518-N6/adenine1519-N6)-dimethyltransferase
LLDPADSHQLESLLRRHRITLRHRLGQNFLIDSAIRDSVAAAAGLTSSDEVLEVGAGVGTLTVALAPRAGRVVAVEFDAALLPALRAVVAGQDNVEVVQADILRYDVRSAFPGGGEVVAGNIPYNLTGALIPKLLDEAPRPRRLGLVVQQEVAERWTASTSASLATVAVQVFTEPRIVLTIPATSFLPSPKVDSALVILDVRDQPAVEVADLGAFFRFVEAVFQFRRKQLGGILNRMGAGKDAPGELGIDPTRRPQTLTLREWEILYRAVNSTLDR